MKSFIVAFLAVAFCIGASSALPTIGDLWYGFSSTLRVINNLCGLSDQVITDQLATDFFNCYDAAPAGGRAIYTDCQIKMGAVMNTTEGIKKTCKTLYTFPLYVKCLSAGFKAANISTFDAVNSVNACEEQVLGTAK